MMQQQNIKSFRGELEAKAASVLESARGFMGELGCECAVETYRGDAADVLAELSKASDFACYGHSRSQSYKEEYFSVAFQKRCCGTLSVRYCSIRNLPRKTTKILPKPMIPARLLLDTMIQLGVVRLVSF